MDTVSINTEPQALPHNDDFAKTVEESKQKIAEAAFVETKKRGRGRPPKAPSHTQAAPGPVPNQAQNSSGIPMASSATPPPDISGFIVEPLIALSKIPAKNHKIEELALTREEAQACAVALNECVKAFIPDLNAMNPKTAAILGLCLTVGSIGFTKYQVYLDKKPKNQVAENEPNSATTNDFNSIPAENYFRR